LKLSVKKIEETETHKFGGVRESRKGLTNASERGGRTEKTWKMKKTKPKGAAM